MYRTLPFLFFTTLLLLTAGCGGAGDGQAFWQALVSQILDVVIIVATPLLILVAHKLVQVFSAKTGIAVDEQRTAQLDSWVEKGIRYAEEQAHKALKDGKDPLDGDAKKIAAVDFVAEALKSTGAVTWSRDALEKLVESKLHTMRVVDAPIL